MPERKESGLKNECGYEQDLHLLQKNPTLNLLARNKSAYLGHNELVYEVFFQVNVFRLFKN